MKIYDVDTELQCILHFEEISDKIQEGTIVWVKVIAILDDRVRLTMKGIDQKRGTEFTEHRKNRREDYDQNKDFGDLTGIKIELENNVDMEGNAASFG